jgi:hypothetical protein
MTYALNEFDLNTIKLYINIALSAVFQEKELSPEAKSKRIEHGEKLKEKIYKLNDWYLETHLEFVESEFLEVE